MTSSDWFTSVFVGLVVLALVVYAILILLVGRNTADLAYLEQPDQQVLDRTDARYWKLGMYLNPQDPALFVPKLLGWTINIGHPKGRLVAASLLLGIALLIVLISWLPILMPAQR
jgi:uncharacterized membrane protein